MQTAASRRDGIRTGAVTNNCAVASIPLPPVPVNLPYIRGMVGACTLLFSSTVLESASL